MTRLRYYILDESGEPQPVDDVLVWTAWFERASHDGSRIVKQDYAEGSVREGVSTVFLGIDHNHTLRGAPVLWESLVFGTSLDGEQQRYRSKADALRGHEELLQRVSAAWKDEH